ncbi:MAG TPA: glycosyl transferase family 1 [Microscillaceae bacterium]|nr:glycosyl transferase family 1 [Microscillaceae bacterium]
MKIGFDAKRAFFNRSGLGNYSRNMLQLLAQYYPEHAYVLYTPSTKDTLDFTMPNAHIQEPLGWANRKLKSLWRSLWMAKDLNRDDIDLFHGLSNQLPKNIEKFKGKTIVTIHDLIFLRYPELYKKADRMIDTRKFRHAAESANKVISVSEQTKADLVDFFDINPDKIEVVYQGCHAIFQQKASVEAQTKLQQKYQLPADFLLSVGTIEARKNIGIVVQALQKHHIDIPLVVVGQPTPYLEEVKALMDDTTNVIFLHQVPLADLPGLYQMAKAFIYPSLFEGFGIPIVEALFSDTPVITSEGSCFPESGGDAAYYIDPTNIESVGEGIQKVLSDSSLQTKMIEKGQHHRQQFTDQEIANNLMKVYQEVMK